VTVNPDAVNEITPREGGFVARNRINFANVNTPTLSDAVMNVLKLLKIPKKTVVTDIYLISVVGGAAVTHNCNSDVVTSATCGIGWIAYKSASLSSTSTVTEGFAEATLTKSKIHTSSVVALPTVVGTPKGAVRHIATDIAGGAHGWADGADNGQVGMYFPYGGFVTFQATAGKGASGTAASSLDGEFSGVLEISATGFKVPE